MRAACACVHLSRREAVSRGGRSRTWWRDKPSGGGGYDSRRERFSPAAGRTYSGGVSIVPAVSDWFVRQGRDLPWRRRGFGAWGILVSEIMLQQTPVVRVIPRLEEWLERWPTPADLAAVPSGEAVRAWHRLGYPRRALNLHAAAVAITERHGGVVPRSIDELLALPGVGDYTARAVAAFAYGDRHPVVDTNVRRVLARAIAGQGEAGPPSTKRDLAAMEAILPERAGGCAARQRRDHGAGCARLHGTLAPL